ncbi:MAG TPA: hypothetical protein VLK59_09675, partial [Solirubrobacteraceae bacterium]|nr:hypothetical protein [Solirubrobacteraceae bacterium]
RMLAEMARHPSRAYKLVVPHVLLTGLGHVDEAFDAFARARCAAAAALATAGFVPTLKGLALHG